MNAVGNGHVRLLERHSYSQTDDANERWLFVPNFPAHVRSCFTQTEQVVYQFFFSIALDDFAGLMEDDKGYVASEGCLMVPIYIF